MDMAKNVIESRDKSSNHCLGKENEQLPIKSIKVNMVVKI